MKEIFKKVINPVTAEPDPTRDWSVGLIVLGTLYIFLGILCFSLAMLLLIVVSSVGLHGMKPTHYWMMMTFLFYLTGWFIVMGLGSVKAQRWARALLLVGGWVAVFFSSLTLALILYILPEVCNLLADSGLIQPTAALSVLCSAILILIVLQIVFPLIGIFFYGLTSVQATCERRNPHPCWTDRCPLPLLAMSFISVLGCVSIITGSTINYTVFFYGHVVSGFPGMLVVAGVALACGYVGWGAFTRKMHAWWGAYTIVLLMSSSMMLTFSEMDMDSLYAHMGYSSEQIEALGSFAPFSLPTLTFISCAWGIMASYFHQLRLGDHGLYVSSLGARLFSRRKGNCRSEILPAAESRGERRSSEGFRASHPHAPRLISPGWTL